MDKAAKKNNFLFLVFGQVGIIGPVSMHQDHLSGMDILIPSKRGWEFKHAEHVSEN